MKCAASCNWLGVAAALIASCVFADAPPGIASSPTIAPRNVQFSNLTTFSGLSQEFVHAVVQDRDGYLWFGTQQGLNRYDGYEVRVYEHNQKDPRSLSHSFVWSLMVDDEGVLWVGTDGGLNRYDAATDDFDREPFTSLGIPLGAIRIRTMDRDQSGTFWLGTVDQGLVAIDPRQRTRVEFRHKDGDATGLPNDSVIALHEDRKGNLWVGTDGGGLARMDRVTDSFVTYRNDPSNPRSVSDDQIRCIAEDRAGHIWVGTAVGGLNLFDATTGTFKHFTHDPTNPRSLPEGQVPTLLEDSRGTLWVGTESGLAEWRPEISSFVAYRHDARDATSLLNDRVNALYQDSSGVLWVGTHGGVSRWNYFSDTFSYFRAAEGFLNSDVVTSIAESSNGTLWVGTYGAGLTRLNLASGQVTHFRNDPRDPKSLSDDRVMVVTVDDQDIVWVGTRNGGLNRLDPVADRFTVYRHSPTDAQSLSGDGISSVLADADGSLWVGVFGGGLNRSANRQSVRFEHFRHDPNDPTTLSGDRVLAVHRDRSGALWVGTEKAGLNRYDNKRGFSRVPLAPTANATDRGETVWEITETRDGSLWVGTLGSGLFRSPAQLRTAGNFRFDRFTRTDGLASDTVYGVLESADGALWLSSNRGLSRFDVAKQQFRHFDQRNGLRGTEFNQGARLRSRSGRLLFGGTDGLVAFYPGELPRNEHIPTVSVTARSREEVLASGKSGKAVPFIELSDVDSFVSFEFAGLDFVSPDKNHHRYTLEGFDADWIEADQFRRAIYTNLPPGDYVFRVQAANNDGVWNLDGAAVNLRVNPPPWSTWWAYCLYVLAVAAIVVAYLRRQKRELERVAAQREHLEQEVGDRTRELAERNDELEALNGKLAQAVVTDSLTGLHNRRFVDQFITAEIATVERRVLERDGPAQPNDYRDSSKMMFFMMIDLDGFKAINDSYGHHAGDKALIHVKDVLLECSRKSDSVVRWGGDEFMVIGHASSLAGVKILAERIRESIAERSYELGDGTIVKLSASIGFAPYPFCPGRVAPGTWEQIAGAADHAAYIAKANGRNAWVAAYGNATTRAEDLGAFAEHAAHLHAEGRIELDSSLGALLSLHKGEIVTRRAASSR